MALFSQCLETNIYKAKIVTFLTFLFSYNTLLTVAKYCHNLRTKNRRKIYKKINSCLILSIKKTLDNNYILVQKLCQYLATVSNLLYM